MLSAYNWGIGVSGCDIIRSQFPYYRSDISSTVLDAILDRYSCSYNCKTAHQGGLVVVLVVDYSWPPKFWRHFEAIEPSEQPREQPRDCSNEKRKDNALRKVPRRTLF